MRTRRLNDFSIIDEAYFTFKPENYLHESFDIHKISYDESMLFSDKWDSIRNAFIYINTHRGGFFCCHANHIVFGTYGYFDEQIFRQMASGWKFKTYEWYQKLNLKWISTHTIAKKYLSISNYGLRSVCDYLSIEFDHHNCKEDTRATEEIFKKLVPEKLTLKELLQIGNYKHSTGERHNGNLRLI